MKMIRRSTNSSPERGARATRPAFGDGTGWRRKLVPPDPDRPVPGASTSPERIRDLPLVTLGVAAGATDAMSFEGLGHVFAGVVTGNLLLLGIGGVRHDGSLALLAGCAIVGYVAGVLVASPRGCQNKGEDRRAWPVGVTVALAMAGVLLLAFTVAWEATGGHPGHEVTGDAGAGRSGGDGHPDHRDGTPGSLLDHVPDGYSHRAARSTRGSGMVNRRVPRHRDHFRRCRRGRRCDAGNRLFPGVSSTGASCTTDDRSNHIRKADRGGALRTEFAAREDEQVLSATGPARSSPGVPVESAARSGELLFNPRANGLRRGLEQFGYGGTDEPRRDCDVPPSQG